MIAKWETRYEWVWYSHSKRGWLCKICAEYADTGDAYWKTEATRHADHPKRLFEAHLKCSKHSNAIRKKQGLQSMSRRGSILTQLSLSSIQKKT